MSATRILPFSVNNDVRRIQKKGMNKSLTSSDEETEIDFTRMILDNTVETQKKTAVIAHDNRQMIKDVCNRVLPIPVGTDNLMGGSPLDSDNVDMYLRFVNGMLLVRLENPFEKILKQRVQNAVTKTVQPILKRLDALEMKVAAYERNVQKLPIKEDELAKDLDQFRKRVTDPVDDRVLGKANFKDDCLIIPGESLKDDYSGKKLNIKSQPEKQQLVVRVTSWTCNSVFVPENFDYHIDLTKRTLNFLVEEEPAAVLLPEKKTRNRKISRSKI